MKNIKKTILYVCILCLTLCGVTTCVSNASVKIEQPVVIPEKIWESAQISSEKFDVPTENIIAMILVENRGFNPKLRSKTSDSGLCQINDGILKDFYSCGYKDVYDIQQNIDFATMRLKWANESYSNWHQTYMVYNMGGTKAKKMFKKGVTKSKYSKKCMKYLSIKDNWIIDKKEENIQSCMFDNIEQVKKQKEMQESLSNINYKRLILVE